MVKVLFVAGIAFHLSGCALAVPAAVGAGVATVVTQHNQPPADYIPPRPAR